MWFLLHCYEDQGKIDEALKLCEEVSRLVHDFGGEGLGQQHKFWQYLEEKRAELLELDEQGKKYGVAGEGSVSLNRLQTCSSPGIPPKKVVKGFTF